MKRSSDHLGLGMAQFQLQWQGTQAIMQWLGADPGHFHCAVIGLTAQRDVMRVSVLSLHSGIDRDYPTLRLDWINEFLEDLVDGMFELRPPTLARPMAST